MGTILLFTCFDATAVLNYNTSLNIGTSIVVDNTSGIVDVIFSTSISGIPTTTTVLTGTSQIQVFPTALSVTIGSKTLGITGLSQSAFQGVPLA